VVGGRVTAAVGRGRHCRLVGGAWWQRHCPSWASRGRAVRPHPPRVLPAQIKTRLQKQRPLADGTMPYRGFLDCAAKISASEGPTAFYKVSAPALRQWRRARGGGGECASTPRHTPASAHPQGLSTYIVRIAPHAIITLIAMDYLNAAAERWRRGGVAQLK
jgi:hypothetical protein